MGPRLAREADRRTGQEQRADGMGLVLHGRGGPDRRVSDRQSAVRAHVCQPGTTAVRSSVHRRADRHALHPPVPGQRAALTITPQNPDTRDWSRYTPINGAVSYWYQNKTPYTEQYFVSLQREFRGDTVLTASYIGSQAHNQLVLLAANPGNPALCLSLSQLNAVMSGTPTCGPFGENSVYTRPDGSVVNGTRQPFGNSIGSDGYFMNNGKSH